MPHPIYGFDHLTSEHADRFRREAHTAHGVVDLPGIPAIRAEVIAMLEQTDSLERTSETNRTVAVGRYRTWLQRWFLWLRAMPLP